MDLDQHCLSQEKLLSLEFDVPSVHEQKQIADVLSGYDDLIEKNRRRMALLEEAKSMPWVDVYNYYCAQKGVIVGESYIADIQKYEQEVTLKR